MWSFMTGSIVRITFSQSYVSYILTVQEFKKIKIKIDQVRSCDYAKVLYCGSIKIRKRIKLNKN